MVQALHIANGETINDKLAAKNNHIDQVLAAGKSNEEMIEDLYLRTLSRRPSGEEMQRLLKALAESNDVSRRELLEDVYWGVMSSREFLFNH
jgi:hypothetical protein